MCYFSEWGRRGRVLRHFLANSPHLHKIEEDFSANLLVDASFAMTLVYNLYAESTRPFWQSHRPSVVLVVQDSLLRQNRHCMKPYKRRRVFVKIKIYLSDTTSDCKDDTYIKR